jgi:hypothetical protein
MEPAIGQTLDYARPDTASPCPAVYKAAMFFAIAPIAVGLACLVLYLLSHSIVFAFLGLLDIYAGCGSVMISVIFLFGYWWTAPRSSPGTNRVIKRRVVVCVLTILANFPLAAICTFVGMKLVDKK